MEKWGTIGCGQMGRALTQAAAQGGTVPWLLANRTPAKAAALAQEVGGQVADNATIAAQCHWIVLAVKPQTMPAVLAEIAPLLRARSDRFVLVSVAAGLTTARLQELSGGAYPIIRLMPNTPVLVGRGMIPYCSAGVTAQEESAFLSQCQAAGRFDAIPEAMMDAASALTGCGPAFVCQFIEALADGAVACGLPRSKALPYAAQTLAGTAELMLATGQHPGVMKDAVCSPGGSTIMGVRRLEEGALRADVMDAVLASYQKTKELGK